MRTKALALMAVLALALSVFAFLPETDADTGVAVDTEKGTITLTMGEIVATDDIEDIIGGLDGVTYKIALADDIELTFVNMSDYELIKPFIKSGYAVIPVATVVELGDDWEDYVTAILSFVEDDDENAKYVAYDEEDGWVGAVQTIAVFDTPAKAAALFASEKAAAVASITGEKDAVIAGLEAQVTQLTADLEQTEAQLADAQAIIADDDSAATIAELTKTKESQEKQIADLTKQIADLKAENATLDKDPVPFYQSGLGQCVIIIVAFLVVMVVWYLFKNGKFDKLFKSKKKEEPKA